MRKVSLFYPKYAIQKINKKQKKNCQELMSLDIIIKG